MLKLALQSEWNALIRELRPDQDVDTCLKYKRLAVLCLLLLLAGTVIGIIVPAGPGWDFANFYDTGRRAAAWQINDIYNPESLIAGAKPQGNMAYWGAPVSAFFFTPLSLFSPIWAMVVFKIQNTLAYFAALGLLYLHNRRFTEATPVAQWRFAALFAGLSLLYQPFWTIYRVGGQTTPTILLLFTVALLAYTRNRLWLSSACLATAVLIKPAFIFVLLLLCFVSGWRFARNITIILTVVGVVSILILGWGIHAEFLRVMWAGSKGGFHPWFFNSSLYTVGENLKLLAQPPADATTVNIIAIGVKLSVLAFFVHLLWRSREMKWDDQARRHFHFLMAIAFCLLISQTVLEHYLASLFLLLIYIVASHRHFSFGALALIGAIFALAIGQNLILVNFLRYTFNFDSTPELTLIGLYKSAPLLLTLIFLWRYRQALFESYTAFAYHKG